MKISDESYTKFKLLSIDAWRDECGWTWNNWFELEDGIYFADSHISTRRILRALRRWGYLSDESKGKVTIDDDGYNLVIQNRKTFEPIFALQYGDT
jgi:hypothetical protein